MIGKRLKEQRIISGMSQKELAERLNVSNSTIQKWEQDIADPNTGKLIELAKLFKCSTDYLFGFVGQDKDIESYVLFEEIKRLDKDQKEQVERFIKFVRGSEK